MFVGRKEVYDLEVMLSMTITAFSIMFSLLKSCAVGAVIDDEDARVITPDSKTKVAPAPAE